MSAVSVKLDAAASSVETSETLQLVGRKIIFIYSWIQLYNCMLVSPWNRGPGENYLHFDSYTSTWTRGRGKLNVDRNLVGVDGGRGPLAPQSVGATHQSCLVRYVKSCWCMCDWRLWESWADLRAPHLSVCGLLSQFVCDKTPAAVWTHTDLYRYWTKVSLGSQPSVSDTPRQHWFKQLSEASVCRAVNLKSWDALLCLYVCDIKYLWRWWVLCLENMWSSMVLCLENTSSSVDDLYWSLRTLQETKQRNRSI